jgi:hypothetical protein
MEKTCCNFIFYFSLLSLLTVLSSCETEDILPNIQLSVDSDNLSEDNGLVTLTASFNSSLNQMTSVAIIVGGTAQTLIDFNLSSESFLFEIGSNSSSIEITALQDNEIEGIESLIFSVANSSNFLILENNQIEISLLDDDSDSDSDGVLDAIDSCPSEVGPDANNGCPWLGFLINEINYDPVTSPEGDANGDGTRSAHDDEFIEFFNSGPEIDLTGYTISDADAVRHTFPSGESLIPSNGVLVVFGGSYGGAGDPIGDFGGAIVQVANGFENRLSMNNNGDVMTISDPSGNPILTFDIEPLSNNPNESYTRNPDLTGEFEQHADIESSGGRLFSPGTKLDGTPFN